MNIAIVNILALLVGSILIGIGTDPLAGVGVFIIGFSWHQTFMSVVNDMYAATFRNMKQIYDKLPEQ